MLKRTIESIWKYNWAPDVTPYNQSHKPFRWLLSPGKPGLFLCTWPKSAYLPEGTKYKNEVWSGIEYQVASNLIWEGFVTEGLAICKAIHERFQPGSMNPYNEIECGSHYARAMASWGVYLALAGFKYHGPKGVVGFDPKITPENFKATFTFAEGWASFSQKREPGKQWETIRMQLGSLKIHQLLFSVEDGKEAHSVLVKVDGKEIPSKVVCRGREVVISLADTLELTEKQKLEVLVKV